MNIGMIPTTVLLLSGLASFVGEPHSTGSFLKSGKPISSVEN